MSISPAVQAIGQIYFEGDVIPHAWYQSPLLKLKNGKANLTAIVLLADVVYWYRPTLIRDEQTGRVVETRQKFHADKLQVSYDAWAERFGLTKRQAQDAFAFLKSKGLVSIELRTVLTGGRRIPNVVFIEPAVNKIKEISQLLGGVTLKRDISPGKTGNASRSKARYRPVKRETYTDTSTRDYPIDSSPALERFLSAAAARVNESSYRQWFQPITRAGIKGDTLYVQTSDPAAPSLIKVNYFDVLEEIQAELSVQHIEFTVSP
jgi:hypothetical protein